MKEELKHKRDHDLVGDLLSQPNETTWLEFKSNSDDSMMIGKLVSALSNSARLDGRETAFVVWGIDDKSRVVSDTTFDPSSKTVGNQVFELWLRNKLSPTPAFQFRPVAHQGCQLVLLEIPAATGAPTAFEGVPYIRVGSATPRLTDDPARYQALIEKMRSYAWESGVAESYVAPRDVLDLLDHSSYFRLTKQNPEVQCSHILEKLEADRLVQRDVGGRWNICNLGAILFANKLGDFGGSMERKGARFVRYAGSDRTTTVTRRVDGQKGYASGFENLLEFINQFLPQNEYIGQALRQTQPLFPALAIRELVANALIHQDLTITGTGPLIELFQDRIEITNPGAPLIDPDRMVDQPPRSRNEAMASLMRRMGMCEEQGSGLDKVFAEVEFFQLPAPHLKKSESSMQVVLCGPRAFAEMSAEERVRACYWHSVLKFMGGERMKNSSLCDRLGIDRKNAAQASGVIGETLKKGLIKHADEAHPKAGYYPGWA